MFHATWSMFGEANRVRLKSVKSCQLRTPPEPSPRSDAAAYNISAGGENVDDFRSITASWGRHCRVFREPDNRITFSVDAVLRPDETCLDRSRASVGVSGEVEPSTPRGKSAIIYYG